ncbi:glycosyltransferase [Caulobacter sp. 73W]|uniref:Glycosyltransferase n=1 Tax=Caulobacter sp. 73W TaxID=3161137 RepID=A0AB39KYJ0_9CAUL
MLRQHEACGSNAGEVWREIATLDAPESSYLTRLTLPVHPLGVNWTVTDGILRKFYQHYRYSPLFPAWLEANVRRFDAVIVHGLWNYLPFAASRVLPHAKVPYFLFTHGMMDPWFRRTYPVKHAAKQISWSIGEGRLARGARAVFFTSEEERRQAGGEFFGHGYNAEVVGYGASAPPAVGRAQIDAFRSVAPALGSRRYLLFMGRIHEKKGCDILIRAFARVAQLHPELDLVIAGPDQSGWRSVLEALAAGLGIADRIHWTGAVYGDPKWGAIYGAEAFVLPSHQENFGIAVAEALGCGTAVLISDKVNIWREISSAQAGIVSADTEKGCTEQITQWLSLPDERKKETRLAAKALFERMFNVNSTAPALIERIREHL